MDYTPFLPLTEVKTYLRVNANNTENDSMITTMINTSCHQLETMLNILLIQRNKVYQNPNLTGLRIYDAPINSVVSPTDPNDFTRVDHDLYSHFYLNATSLELSVGYSNPADAPEWIKDIAKEMIDILYYGAKDGKTIEKDLSPLSKMIISQNKRFTI